MKYPPETLSEDMLSNPSYLLIPSLGVVVLTQNRGTPTSTEIGAPEAVGWSQYRKLAVFIDRKKPFLHKNIFILFALIKYLNIYYPC